MSAITKSHKRNSSDSFIENSEKKGMYGKYIKHLQQKYGLTFEDAEQLLKINRVSDNSFKQWKYS